MIFDLSGDLPPAVSPPSQPVPPHPEDWPIPSIVLEAVETLWQAALLAVQADTEEARREAAALAYQNLRMVAELVALHAARHREPLDAENE
jgi:hypothetical protein